MYDEEILNEIIENSFKNFHTKGFDYICLKRSEEHTRKAYFFDGDVAKLPDVVNPHDHRYNFTTTVVSGTMSNSHYEISDAGIVYNEFAWNTPLNGGDGFSWVGETRLLETKRIVYANKDRMRMYDMNADEFHTIHVHSDQAIIILDQYEDIVPIGKPTRTFMQEKKAPNLDGLYEKFTADEVIHRLGILSTFGISV